MEIAGEMQIDVLHRHHLRIAAAGGAALHAERGPERRLAQAQHRLLADVIERVGEADRGGGLALAGRRRRDRRHQDQLAVRLALQRLDVIHRHLGLVVAIGVEIFRRDAELFLGDVDDRPLLGGLRNFDVGFRILMLRGGHGMFPFNASAVSRRFRVLIAGNQVNRAPAASLAVATNSPASIFLPPAGCTRVTLKRPSAQTTVKPSLSTATISPSLPAMPLGSLAGSGLASKIFSVLPSSVAPGAGRRIAAADQRGRSAPTACPSRSWHCRDRSGLRRWPSIRPA